MFRWLTDRWLLKLGLVFVFVCIAYSIISSYRQIYVDKSHHHHLRDESNHETITWSQTIDHSVGHKRISRVTENGKAHYLLSNHAIEPTRLSPSTVPAPKKGKESIFSILFGSKKGTKDVSASPFSPPPSGFIARENAKKGSKKENWFLNQTSPLYANYSTQTLTMEGKQF